MKKIMLLVFVGAALFSSAKTNVFSISKNKFADLVSTSAKSLVTKIGTDRLEYVINTSVRNNLTASSAAVFFQAQNNGTAFPSVPPSSISELKGPLFCSDQSSIYIHASFGSIPPSGVYVTIYSIDGQPIIPPGYSTPSASGYLTFILPPGIYDDCITIQFD